MAIGEFVSVLDIEIAQMKIHNRMVESNGLREENIVGGKLPNPFQAALASALAFLLGAVVPLLAAVIIDYGVGLIVVAAATTTALVAFGSVGAVLGRSRLAWSCARMVVGAWTAMAITFGLIKSLGASGLEM